MGACSVQENFGGRVSSGVLLVFIAAPSRNHRSQLKSRPRHLHLSRPLLLWLSPPGPLPMRSRTPPRPRALHRQKQPRRPPLLPPYRQLVVEHRVVISDWIGICIIFLFESCCHCATVRARKTSASPPTQIRAVQCRSKLLIIDTSLSLSTTSRASAAESAA